MSQAAGASTSKTHLAFSAEYKIEDGPVTSSTPHQRPSERFRMMILIEELVQWDDKELVYRVRASYSLITRNGALHARSLPYVIGVVAEHQEYADGLLVGEQVMRQRLANLARLPQENA